MASELTFTIDTKGELTDRQYTGVFTIKSRLTQRDFLLQDQFRRDNLGTNTQDASPGAIGIATAVSHLRVRILKAPKWWTDSDGGLDLEDGNILAEVYYKAVETEAKERNALAEEVNKAQQELKKLDVG